MSTTKMRFLGYITISSILSICVILLAFIERPNFYSACIAISQNSASLFTLINMAMILVLLFGKLLQLAFFGHLRALELEHLYERTWYAIMETFLAMTIFHDEFTFQFASMFSVLTFLRVFHWIAHDRVDLIFQTINPPSTFSKLRLWCSLMVLLVGDICMFFYCGSEVLEHGPGTMVMFCFEFAILCNSLVNSTGKFLLNLFESNYLVNNEDEDVWEPKGTYTFVLEVISDTLRLVAYITLFMFLLDPYGIPLHIFRDVYTTAISLFKRYRDFIRFRRARAKMDEQIANAVQEDLIRDSVCIICREEMVISDNQSHRYIPKKLLCGHVIHHGCLKSWLERSQRCPTCRRPVIEEDAGHRPPAQPHPPAQAQQQVQVHPPGHVQIPGQPPAQILGQGQTLGQIGQNQPQLQPQLHPPTTPDVHNTPTTSSQNTNHFNQVPSDNILTVDSTNITVPTGWSVFKALDINGTKQIKLNSNTWGTVKENTLPEEIPSIPSTSNNGTSSSSSTEFASLFNTSSTTNEKLEIIESMLKNMEQTQKEFRVSIRHLREAAESLREQQTDSQEQPQQ